MQLIDDCYRAAGFAPDRELPLSPWTWLRQLSSPSWRRRNPSSASTKRPMASMRRGMLLSEVSSLTPAPRLAAASDPLRVDVAYGLGYNICVIVHRMWRVDWHDDASLELSKLPMPERVALIHAADKLKALGPRCPFRTRATSEASKDYGSYGRAEVGADGGRSTSGMETRLSSDR